MTLAELRALFDLRTNYAGTAVSANTDVLLNLVYREILAQPRFAPIRDTTTLLRTEAGVAEYGIPSLSRIDQILDPSNRRALGHLPVGQYRSLVPDPAAWTGTPQAMVPLGEGIWWRRPRTSLELFANSASDDALTIRLRLLYPSTSAPPGVGGTADEGFGLDVTNDFAVDGTGAATAVYAGHTPSDVLTFENVNTAHVGTVTLREAARTAPDPPVATDTGTGTYPAVARAYRIRWIRPRADGSLEYSAASTVDTITPSGAGEAVRLTRPTGAAFDSFAATTAIAITAWVVEVTLDGTPDGDARWRELATVDVDDTTYDDTTLPEDYAALPQTRGVFTSGAIIAQLPPMSSSLTATSADRRARLVPQVAIYPTPDSAYDLTVTGEAELRVLIGDNDQPELLPTAFHDLLAQGAVMYEYERRSDQRWAQARQLFEQRLAQLAAWMHNHRASRRPELNVHLAGDRGLSLGPWFPARVD